MPLYKLGKEHTINFIYCGTSLHLDSSFSGVDLYSQRLGEESLVIRMAWYFARTRK